MKSQSHRCEVRGFIARCNQSCATSAAARTSHASAAAAPSLPPQCTHSSHRTHAAPRTTPVHSPCTTSCSTHQSTSASGARPESVGWVIAAGGAQKCNGCIPVPHTEMLRLQQCSETRCQRRRTASSHLACQYGFSVCAGLKPAFRRGALAHCMADTSPRCTCGSMSLLHTHARARAHKGTQAHRHTHTGTRT